MDIGTATAADLVNAMQAILPKRATNPALGDLEESPHTFATEYLRYNLYRKCADSNDALQARDRALSAHEKFMAGERQIKDAFENGLSARTEQVLHTARDIMLTLFDRIPSESELLEYAQLTSGATAMRRRTESHAFLKLSDTEFSVTPRCYREWHRILHCIFDSRPCLYIGCKQEFVPKTNQVDRMIAKECVGNVVMQRAFARYMLNEFDGFKYRGLKHTYSGYDVSQQSIKHSVWLPFLEEEGLATIDMENASNTIASTLIKKLLPSWLFNLLETVRSDRIHLHRSVGDGFYKPELFSANGNGFTFELETIVFWALSIAVIETSEQEHSGKVSVFGDDIILPSSAVAEFGNLAKDIGMSLNRDKSFVSGPFRESCGAHNYRAYNVAPPFLREIGTTRQSRIANLIAFANRLREWDWFEITPPVQELYNFVVSLLPEGLRTVRLPLGYSDDALTGETWLDSATIKHGTAVVSIKRPAYKKRSRHERIRWDDGAYKFCIHPLFQPEPSSKSILSDAWFKRGPMGYVPDLVLSESNTGVCQNSDRFVRYRNTTREILLDERNEPIERYTAIYSYRWQTS